jgi:hypothetical protein
MLNETSQEHIFTKLDTGEVTTFNPRPQNCRNSQPASALRVFERVLL